MNINNYKLHIHMREYKRRMLVLKKIRFFKLAQISVKPTPLCCSITNE